MPKTAVAHIVRIDACRVHQGHVAVLVQCRKVVTSYSLLYSGRSTAEGKQLLQSASYDTFSSTVEVSRNGDEIVDHVPGGGEEVECLPRIRSYEDPPCCGLI